MMVFIQTSRLRHYMVIDYDTRQRQFYMEMEDERELSPERDD